MSSQDLPGRVARSETGHSGPRSETGHSGPRSETGHSNAWAWRAALLAVLLLAFGLRAYHLDFQSLWSDEGISLLRSSQPLGQMLATMPVEHLPGYFVLLNGWLTLAGEQDFALRFLSLLPSVLAVALAYRLSADLSSRFAGLTAALLLATGAFQVWYAQEARMYSWLLATSLLATWLLWRLLAGPRRAGLAVAAGYALAIAATIYLHVYGFLVPLGHAVFALGWLWRGRPAGQSGPNRDWAGFRRWVLAGLAIFLLFLPWLPRTLQILDFPGWREPLDPWQLPGRFLAAYTVGDAMSQPWADWLPWLYLLLAASGALVWWRRQPAASALLLCNLLAPFLAAWLLAFRSGDYHERYAIFLSGPLLLLIGGGIAGLNPLGFDATPAGTAIQPAATQPGLSRGLTQRRLAALPSLLILAGLLLANGAALQRLYSDASLHKPDFRSAAQAIQRQEQPGDVILVDGPDPEKVFLHYYRGQLPVYDLRSLQEADGEQVAATLNEATAGRQRAWEVLYFRPPGPVQVWLATRGWAAPAELYNDIRVTLYGLAGQPLTRQELNLPVGPALILEAAEASQGPARPGQLLRITTNWQVLQAAPEYKFSLRLQDAAGQIRASDDYVPQNWFAPTPVWIVGQPARDQRGLLLPPGLPPGGYRITLRLYDPASGAAVETNLGTDMPLAEIEIMP